MAKVPSKGDLVRFKEPVLGPKYPKWFKELIGIVLEEPKEVYRGKFLVKVIWNNEQKTTNENLEALEVINEGS